MQQRSRRERQPDVWLRPVRQMHRGSDEAGHWLDQASLQEGHAEEVGQEEGTVTQERRLEAGRHRQGVRGHGIDSLQAHRPAAAEEGKTERVGSQ